MIGCFQQSANVAYCSSRRVDALDDGDAEVRDRIFGSTEVTTSGAFQKSCSTGISERHERHRDRHSTPLLRIPLVFCVLHNF